MSRCRPAPAVPPIWRRSTGSSVPALERFAPEFILVANGLDASLGDPLGRMNLTSECFALMTARLMSFADALCDGRLVLCHEGGYSSTYVPYCGLAIVEQLAGTRTDVVDPWISDARQVRRLPLREHEAQAIERARTLHRLPGDPVRAPAAAD